jgi:hypothetical protein
MPSAYPLDVNAVAGDELRLACTWDNTTPNYILPGPKTSDEMCQLGLIAWPAEAASCRERARPSGPRLFRMSEVLGRRGVRRIPLRLAKINS